MNHVPSFSLSDGSATCATLGDIATITRYERTIEIPIVIAAWAWATVVADDPMPTSEMDYRKRFRRFAGLALLCDRS
jgi:hypothetical protein